MSVMNLSNSSCIILNKSYHNNSCNVYSTCRMVHMPNMLRKCWSYLKQHVAYGSPKKDKSLKREDSKDHKSGKARTTSICK